MSESPADLVAASRVAPVATGLVTAVRWLAVVAALIATGLWTGLMDSGSDWGRVLFLVLVVPWVVGGTLLLGVLPSLVLWRLRRTARDRRNLTVTSACCALLLVEAAALLCGPWGLR